MSIQTSKGEKFIWKKEHQVAFDELKCALMNSDALSFPRYDLPFYLAVDKSSKGISYMLYQKHDTNLKNIHVIRFGSKSLAKWQQSYGPTKLELFGMIASIIDCSTYLRGHRVIVECDHQALKPLFQKHLKGAIYERWLAILQEFNFEIQYKPAEQMIGPDSLSRCQPNAKSDPAGESPDETDPCFPYVPEHTGEITLPNGITLQELMKSTDKNVEVNYVLVSHNNDIVTHQESDYDGDTEKHHMPRKRIVTKRKTKTQLKCNISQCEIKDLSCTVSTNESQIKEVGRIDLFRNFDFS